MKRKQAIEYASNIARNLNQSAFVWWDLRAEEYKATTYMPPRGWAKKWAEVSPTGEVKIVKLRELRKIA